MFLVVLQWIAGGLLGMIFLVSACGNLVFLRSQLRGEYQSFVPFVGGLAGLLAVLVLPMGIVGTRATYCWLPLVVDVGCLPFLIGFPWNLSIPSKSR